MPRRHSGLVELRHLRYFLTVAEAQNFTRAAQKLRIAQPALSRQIHDLEEELGVTLLERNSRGVRLTAAGESFLSETRAVLQRVEEATAVARAFAQGERGELHVGYAPSPTVELLPRALHAFHGESPGVRVVLHDLTSEELLRGLHEGKLDVALMVRPRAREQRGLTFHALASYPFCVALPPRHPLARAKRIELTALIGKPLVAYSRREYPEYQEWLDELFAPTGHRPLLAEEHDSVTSLITAIEAGRGLALVPSILACMAGSRLRFRELHPAPAPLTVGVAANPKRLSTPAQRFVALLKKIPASKATRARGKEPDKPDDGRNPLTLRVGDL